MLAIPIAYSPSITPTVIAVNSLLYTQPINLGFGIPLDIIAFNRYRLITRCASNAAGQTVNLRVQELGTGTPLGDGTPDLTIPNVATLYDSGDRLVSSTPATFTQYVLALAGSNATVDLSFLWATLYLWQEI